MLNIYRSLHFELETTFKQIILSDKDHQPSWLHHHHHHWYVFLFSTWWSGLMSGGWSPGEWSSLTGEDDQNQRNNELSSWRICVWLRWQISPDHHNSTTSTSRETTRLWHTVRYSNHLWLIKQSRFFFLEWKELWSRY